MRSNLSRRFVIFTALVILSASLVGCGDKRSPTQGTPLPQPGVEPLWSTVVSANLSVAPNPATTRSALQFSGVTIQVQQTGIKARDRYVLKYPDGRETVCPTQPQGMLEFINKYDLSGSCDILKTTDPAGTYNVTLEHREELVVDGIVKFFKDFPPITASFPVNKG